MAEQRPDGARRLRAGLGVAVATFLLMVVTEPYLAIAWDEGFVLGRVARVVQWSRAVADPVGFAARWRPPSPGEELVQSDGRRPPDPSEVDTRAKLFTRENLEWFWPFAREEPHGHPPFYAVVGLLGEVATPWRRALPRARLGPMVVFSVTAGALFVFLARRAGTWAGVAAAGAWVLQPRLFAHGHYVLLDALLASLWVQAILAFTKAVEVEPGSPPARRPRWGWAVAFGACAGAAAATKLTGWFLPLPFIAWTLIRRDRRGARTIVVGGLVAVAWLYAFTPPWWGDPIGGVVRFLRSNLTRGGTTYIPTMFLGRVYVTPNGSLPWYNTLAWTVFVTPAGFLALSLAGAWWTVRAARGSPLATLAVANWAALLILRGLPHTPGHDGERQFLAAFGCLAIVAGLGAGRLVGLWGRWGRAVVAVALAEGAVGLALAMPAPLSYYSPLIGGLPGASRLGLEPTYFWDALSDDALARINARAGPGEKVLFSSTPTSFLYLQRIGKLQPRILPGEPGRFAWYVLQDRPGSFQPFDRLLAARARPENVLVEKQGVPLIWIFPIADLVRAQGEAGPLGGKK